MLASFSDFAFTELLVIAAIAVMVFGRDLPRVAAKVIVQLQRARRALQQVWRESGIGEEVRRVQREMERAADTARKASPTGAARAAARDLEAEVRSLGTAEPDEARSARGGAPAPALGVTTEQVEARAPEPPPGPAEPDGAPEPGAEEEEAPGEPAGEAQRRPAWYPEPTDDPFGRGTD